MEPDRGTGVQLSDGEVAGLLAPLVDEYRALAIHRQVLAEIGEDLLPLAKILEAEARHLTRS